MKTLTKSFRMLLPAIYCLFWLSAAQAQPKGENIFIIHDAVGKPDSTVVIYIEIVNEDYFSAFIFDLPLPDGFTYTGPWWWNACLRGCQYTANAAIISGTNIFRVLTVNMTNCGFFGNRGIVMYFSLNTPLQPGAYELIPENVIVWSLGLTIDFENMSGNVYVMPDGPVPGDTNCDGIVNVMDVVISIQYILGNIPKPFCFANADLDDDLGVNVTDAIGIIQIILQME